MDTLMNGGTEGEAEAGKMTKLPPVKPGRVDGKNSEYRSGIHRIPKRCHNEIEVVLQQNRDKAAHKDKKVGSGTQDKRETVIKGFFSDLFYLGYKIESIHSLKQKHLQAVFGFLEDQGQSPSTIQNKISIMRVFSEWVGKYGMVGDSTKYVKNRASVRRSMVVQEDKSWDGNGFALLDQLPEIATKDEDVAMWLEIIWAFGLRVREGIMSRPGASADGLVYWVKEGTKGGRSRVVPIETDVQRDVIERAKKLADGKTGLLGKRGKSYKQKRDHFYYILKVCGFTLKDKGVTAHGLRHEYMQRAFKRLTGIEAPIKGGDLSLLDKKEFHEASQKLMERAGHTRVTIGAAYYGSRRIKKPNPEQSENQNFPEVAQNAPYPPVA